MGAVVASAAAAAEATRGVSCRLPLHLAPWCAARLTAWTFPTLHQTRGHAAWHRPGLTPLDGAKCCSCKMASVGGVAAKAAAVVTELEEVTMGVAMAPVVVAAVVAVVVVVAQ